MKKITIIFAFLLAVMSVDAQLKHTVYDDSTTSVGASAVYTYFPESGSMRASLLGESLSVSGVCTNIGGTSEGTIVVHGTNDGGETWIPVNASSYTDATFYPNDTVTITDGQTFYFDIPEMAHLRYRMMTVGGANDTTGVSQDNVIY